MPQGLHNILRAEALREQQRGTAVPKVVESLTRESEALQEPLKLARQIMPINWSADARGKHETGINPAAPCDEPSLELPDAVRSKALDRRSAA